MAQYTHRYEPDKQVLVVGYPKSGNTWVSRLLGDALDSPVTGWLDAQPLATEGKNRKGEYTVRQLHLHPSVQDGEVFLHDATTAIIPKWKGEKIVHVVRDPRDVIVSAYHYWQMNSMDFAISAVIYGKWPLKVAGPWDEFIMRWTEQLIPVCTTFYERLYDDPVGELNRILSTIEVYPAVDIHDVVERQSFQRKRQTIEKDGDKRPYGRKIQLHNLRKGVPGDWHEHLTHIQLERIYKNIGELMTAIGYLDENDNLEAT